MAEFQLPHDHGTSSQAASLHQEVMQVAHFAAAAEVFKQLSDPTRVRIFWLLSHQEACVINLAAMLEMSSPAVSHHLRSLTEPWTFRPRRRIIRRVHTYLTEHLSERITIEALSREF